MSKYSKGKSDLKDKFKREMTRGIIFISFGGAMVLFLGLSGNKNFILYLLLLLCFCIPGWYFLKGYKYYKYEIRAEEQGIKTLLGLPEEYTVFNSIFLKGIDGLGIKIDTVIVGPNGVFIVDFKGINGSIKGKVTEEFWLEEIKGKSKKQKSLLNLLNKKTKSLDEFFKRKNIDTKVEKSFIYLPLNETTISLDKKSENIVTDNKVLIDNIESYRGVSLSDKNIDNIIKALKLLQRFD